MGYLVFLVLFGHSAGDMVTIHVGLGDFNCNVKGYFPDINDMVQLNWRVVVKGVFFGDHIVGRLDYTSGLGASRIVNGTFAIVARRHNTRLGHTRTLVVRGLLHVLVGLGRSTPEKFNVFAIVIANLVGDKVNIGGLDNICVFIGVVYNNATGTNGVAFGAVDGVYG